MNLVRQELVSATQDYREARMWLRRANSGIDARIGRNDAFVVMNRSRARLMNVIKAANIVLNRVAA